MAADFELLIRPRKGWQPIDLREIWLYRELLGFLIWRDVKIRYRQTILGGLWAVLQPLLAMLIFTLLFNRVAGINSNGPPYSLFSFTGLVAWTFFSNAVTASSNSLLGNQQLVSKVYFPRVFIPVGSIGALLVDLMLGLILVGALMLYHDWPVSVTIFLLPVFLLGTLMAASGVGLTLSALNVQFRDVKYAAPFFVQLGLFITPIIYPIDYIPERYRMILALNPMAGMVDGLRFAMLGTPAHWGLIGISLFVSLILFIVGLFVFRRMERRFADLI